MRAPAFVRAIALAVRRARGARARALFWSERAGELARAQESAAHRIRSALDLLEMLRPRTDETPGSVESQRGPLLLCRSIEQLLSVALAELSPDDAAALRRAIEARIRLDLAALEDRINARADAEAEGRESDLPPLMR